MMGDTGLIIAYCIIVQQLRTLDPARIIRHSLTEDPFVREPQLLSICKRVHVKFRAARTNDERRTGFLKIRAARDGERRNQSD